MPRLQVLNGKRQGAVFEVGPPGEHLIGHRQSATISIDDPWVSWDHARVFWEQDGSCWIEDLGSTNGTYVNCVRVKREVLRHEDIVFLGKTHVIFLAPADEMAALPVDPFASSPTAPGSMRDAVDPFAPSSEGAGLKLPATASAHERGLSPTGSSLSGFESDAGLPPLRDPFASTNAPPGLAAAAMAAAAGSPWATNDPPPVPPTPSGHWPSPSGRPPPSRDPFDESTGDPFDTGPVGMAPPAPPAAGRSRAGAPPGGADPFARPAPTPRPPAVDPFSRPIDPFAGEEAWSASPTHTPGGAADPFARPVDPFARPVDPFARAPIVRDTAREDPFAPDPFDAIEVPDLQDEPLDPFGAPKPDPSRTKRAFADTHADEDGPAQAAMNAAAQAASSGGGKRSLSLSDLREDAEPAAQPSSHEISQLIDHRERSGFDDLDAILGDGRAMTPDPARLVPPGPGKKPGKGLGLPSEMRTRPISTDLAREILEAEEAEARAEAKAEADGKARASAAPARLAGTLGVSAPPLSSRPTPAMPMPVIDPRLLRDEPPPASDQAPPRPAGTDMGALAFERARLDDEVRRLRAALQAAQQRTPQAIKIAADALRDTELGRLARRVAELERDLVMSRQEVEEKQVELDRVTDEMIVKEDRIDSLEEEVRRLRGGPSPVDVPHGLGAMGSAEDEDLEPLDF